MRKKTFKKLFAIAVSVFMLVGMMAPAIAANETFPDMPDNWSTAALQYAIDNGLLFGSNGKILPNDYVTRAQMAAITVRAFGATEKADISKFVDVPSDTWYTNDIAKAVKMGIFVGSGNKMLPGDKITREQAFAVLARAFKLSSTNHAALDKFTDKANIADYFKSEIAALVEAGYVNGSNNTLNPKDYITRAELAQVFYGIVKSYIREGGIYTEVKPGTLMINVPGVTLKNVTITGDLIIGDGVGTGDVTLDNVKVAGRTVIRGGGKNSIHVINGSTLTGTVIIDNVNNEVRIVTDAGTIVQKIEAGSQVILEGQFGEVKVVGSNKTTVEVKGTAKTVVVEAPEATVNVTGKVEKVEVAASAAGAQITGTGSVATVEVKANDVKVSTPNTQIVVAKDVTGTTVGDKKIEGGSTYRTDNTGKNVVPVTPAPSGGGSGGGPSTPAFAISSVVFVNNQGGIEDASAPYVLDLSGPEYDDQENNKRIAFNGFKINANKPVSKVEVVGYSDRYATPDSTGLFTIDTVIGIDVGFDGDITVYTLKNLIGGSISKTLKVYSQDGDVIEILVTLKTSSSGVAVQVPDEFVALYSVSLNKNLATEKEITLTLKPTADGNKTVLDFANFFNDIIELASIPAGYTYTGIYIIENGTEHGPYMGNYGVSLVDALGQPLNLITLNYLAQNQISVKVTGLKGSTAYTATVNF